MHLVRTCHYCSLLLNIKSKDNYVPVFDYILFSLQAYQPLFAHRRDAAARNQVFVRYDLSADKSPLEIRVDLSGSLGSFGARFDGPGPGFVLAGGQKADQAQQLIACGNQLVQAGFGQS